MDFIKVSPWLTLLLFEQEEGLEPSLWWYLSRLDDAALSIKLFLQNLP